MDSYKLVQNREMSCLHVQWPAINYDKVSAVNPAILADSIRLVEVMRFGNLRSCPQCISFVFVTLFFYAHYYKVANHFSVEMSSQTSAVRSFREINITRRVCQPGRRIVIPHRPGIDVSSSLSAEELPVRIDSHLANIKEYIKRSPRLLNKGFTNLAIASC